MTTIQRRNPGWKLDERVIALVAEARAEMGVVGSHEVIARWAKAWKDGLVVPVVGALVPDEVQSEYGVGVVGVAERKETGSVVLPDASVKAERVETPYQTERRIRLEVLRAKLEAGEMTVGEGKMELVTVMKGEPSVVVREKSGVAVGGEEPKYPFDVVLGGEQHRVILYKGRRILEWIGPETNVMKRNLNPQQVMIYWRERIK